MGILQGFNAWRKALPVHFKRNLAWLWIVIIVAGLFFSIGRASSANASSSQNGTSFAVAKREPLRLDETRLRRPPSTTSTTTTTTTTTTAPKRHEGTVSQKPVAAPVTVPPTGDVWQALRNCESHGNYSTNTGNGYYGAYQFSAGTWNSMNTGFERADLAPPEVQDDAARRLQARSGWGQWPACSKAIGVR